MSIALEHKLHKLILTMLLCYKNSKVLASNCSKLSKGFTSLEEMIKNSFSSKKIMKNSFSYSIMVGKSWQFLKIDLKEHGYQKK